MQRWFETLSKFTIEQWILAEIISRYYLIDEPTKRQWLYDNKCIDGKNASEEIEMCRNFLMTPLLTTRNKIDEVLETLVQEKILIDTVQ